MAAEYRFDYALVSYRWPGWLRAQSDKQRVIWAYKILFLDVLFPLHLQRVIFVDADQVVRADLHTLYSMDLHGAPAAQTPQNAFTGQMAPNAGFYEDRQYERALQWLEWMTDLIHKTTEFRNVGMLELVNEPVQDDDKGSSMREKYYPQAWKVNTVTFSSTEPC